MNRAELERRAQLWQRYHAIRAAWLGGAAGFAAAVFLVRTSPVSALAVGVAVMAGVMAYVRRRTPRVTAETMVAHLNRIAPALEESAALWLRDADTLTLVERLQRRRLDAAWESLSDRATLGCPRADRLRPAAAFCTAAALTLIIVASWPARNTSEAQVTQPAPSSPAAKELAPLPKLRNATLTIAPPAYLGATERRMAGLDAEVPEGSVVTWDITFTGEVTGVSLLRAGGLEPVMAVPAGAGQFRARAPVTDTLIYQLAVSGAKGPPVILREIHALRSIRDQPPRLTWQEPAASRTIVDPGKAAPVVAVRLRANDDHGVDGVDLLMTVAKGSGEGVKFREQHIALERTAGATPDGDTFGRSLDLTALGLEPGDELYFQAIASDQRAPEPNRTRSEMRFVVLRGPATAVAEPGLALAGVNRVPQYFRSQRQLIIDTERLLEERATLTPDKFRERSEEIGVDQKLLRLRYGQFLGEEFEPASVGAPKEAQAMAMAGALRSQPRDAASQAAAVERVVEAQHNHPLEPASEGRAKTLPEVMAPFAHQHDNAEAATLFDEHVKASLRSVLAAMWEAEGFLRTARPAEALPAENRALERLQALQQADRVYLKRIGYEAAPLKVAERRLRGELDGIPEKAQETVPVPARDPTVTALTEALAGLGETSTGSLPAETAAHVEARLVAAAQESPEKFIPALEQWRRRTSLAAEERSALRQAVWSLLPAAEERPQRRAEASPNLARDYLDALRSTAGGTR